MTGAGVFVLAFFSMDVEQINPDYILSNFVLQFKFGCREDHKSKWNTELTNQAELLWTMHPVVILMSSTLCLVVLSSIAFHFDRLKKTKKER